MASYKWETPYDWFQSYVNARAEDPQALRSLLLVVAQKLDSDDLQELFQPDMDADGFFENLDEFPESYSFGHDLNGYFLVGPGEEDPDEKGYSLGFDGRTHYETIEEAREAAWQEVRRG